ncbi:4-hydroxybenzoate 3-monooxygenase [Luedemannella helvata]|uniref:4-hydroxybenzoate 3-monooxygenase n=1 Tax=Luedemannella helvata TaxID=349315 RepID=UPI0031D227F3
MERTQVGIIGAGPAGLLLSHLLALAGIESVVVELRSRQHCEQRQRAGLLEAGTVATLRDAGLAKRLDVEGIEHGGIYLQYAGERHHLDFRDLVDRTVTIYAQTEIVKDLIAARLAAGQRIDFSITDTSVSDVDSSRPVLRYVDEAGAARAVECDVIAGCDGFHGISRAAVPDVVAYERAYPFSWLGIIADVAPSTDELIYAHHPDGFALHSVRTPHVSRLYLQVPAGEAIGSWSDERIWENLQKRFALPGWTLREGPIREKAITPMRSFVSTPMRYGRLFLAGDAAHIVPPTGAKGLNLAVSDVALLAPALVAWLRDGDPSLADTYPERALRRVWRATHFSWWMTQMLHAVPGDAFNTQLQLSQLRYVTASRPAAVTLAENYTGSAPA